MNAKEVHKILMELVDMQSHANAGGIVGGKEEEEAAKKDLQRYVKAVEWFEGKFPKVNN